MKKTVIKRMAAFSLAILTCLSMVSCKKEKASAPEGFDDAPVIYVAVKNTFEKKIGKSGDDYKDNPYSRYIYEKTGVRVEPVLLSSNLTEANQQLAVKRAGNQQIDLILHWDISQSYMQSGLIVKLNDLLKEYKDIAPNLTENIPDSAWEGVSKCGVIWGIPGRGTLPNPAVNDLFFRKDWMDKLGLDMPENTDELAEIMKAFTENDPDGNGVDDTYAMVHNGENTANSLMLLFGCNTWNEEYIDGRLVSGAMTDKARKAFITLRSWDKAGYINRDGIVDSKAYENLISGNKAGMIIGGPSELVKFRDALHDNGFVDAEWQMCTTQIKSSNDGIYYGLNTDNKNHNSVTMITSMAKDYESIFKLLNWFYSEEGTFFSNFGLEGREHNLVNGKAVRDEKYIKEKSYLEMYNFGKSYNHYDKELAYTIYGDDDFAKQYVDENINNYDYYVGKKVSLTIKFDYPELPEFTSYPEWRKGISANMMKFVSGDLDPADDKVWNEYLKECRSYGIDKILDAALKAYNADKERTDKIDLEKFGK